MEKAKIKVKHEIDFLVAEFRLIPEEENNLLSDWLDTGAAQLDNWSEEALGKIEPRLRLKIDGWLEEELKMKLLALIFFLSELDETQGLGIFFERPIVAEIENFRISVITDCMVASVYGLTSPQTPYFFMQEFKKSKGDKQDPEGQMLAAMIGAQHLNRNGKPLYGSYVIGREWFFTILEGKHYARSNALQLTKPEELRQVILALRKLKQIILSDLMN